MQDFIVVEDVWKTYKTGKVSYDALRGVSITIEKGSLVAIVGPSGSGKSTLIHLLAGIDVPTRGRVVVDGVEISSLSEGRRLKWRRRNIGIVFQFLHLVPVLTALENVMLPMELAGVFRGERKRRAMELLDFVGMADKAGKLPGELSGGEQQRVAIARALASDPPIILADEPTANLDVGNKRRIIELLARAKERGKTVVYTTHDRELAEIAEVRIVLRDGRVEGVER